MKKELGKILTFKKAAEIVLPSSTRLKKMPANLPRCAGILLAYSPDAFQYFTILKFLINPAIPTALLMRLFGELQQFLYLIVGLMPKNSGNFHTYIANALNA